VLLPAAVATLDLSLLLLFLLLFIVVIVIRHVRWCIRSFVSMFVCSLTCVGAEYLKKRVEIYVEVRFQWTTNMKWHVANRLVT